DERVQPGSNGAVRTHADLIDTAAVSLLFGCRAKSQENGTSNRRASVFSKRLSTKSRSIIDAERSICRKRQFFSSLLVVYLYGFHGSWDRAIKSLLVGGAEAHRHDPDRDVRASALFDLLWRAYVLTEFDELRKRTPNLDFEAMRNTAIERVRDVAESLRQERSDLDLRLGVEAWVDLTERASSEEIKDVRELCLHLVASNRRRKPAAANLERFADGYVASFQRHEDINETYAEFADLIRSKGRPPAATTFRMMAALGKSATNEYHRRQVAIGEDPRPRGRVRIK
ncbi:MAG TPA: hypothetical protein VGR95_23295, partial [Thermoanaerobaculia bacterium]|nr:hypothetical protein [Thermoanaerobaculia bacterium]